MSETNAAGSLPAGASPLPKYPGSDNVQCQFCGCVPAGYATFRGHQGMILLMRFRRTEGVFCRTCGLETFREMTAATMIQGWWGFMSFFITPVVVLLNLSERKEVANLPAPRQHGMSRRPLDPGPPLMARPAAIIGLLIPVVVVLTFVGILASASA